MKVQGGEGFREREKDYLRVCISSYGAINQISQE